MKRIILALGLLASALPAQGAMAAPNCGALSEDAGDRFGVPKGLMAAISLVETGTRGGSWPWTLNEGGKGMHFDTKQAALAYLQDAVNRGVTNIDVGCMQLNYRWHNKGFKSLDQMLDPTLNTNYAALFMVELRKRLGSWEAATANYHSADADRGANYVKKVVAADAKLTGQPKVETAAAEPDHTGESTLPMLLAGGGQGIVTLGAADSDFYARVAKTVSESVVQADFSGQPIESTPITLKTRENLPPRLGRRWQAVLAARNQLAIKR